MISDAEIKNQLPHVLAATHFDFLGQRYEGKVRDNYSSNGTRYIITSDRLSAFDVVVTTIPYKGQVLNHLANFWFKRTAQIVPNHIIDIPDPNVLVVKSCEILPIEVVLRAYISGSAWRDYQAGKDVSGVKLPAGLKASQKLPEVIITPSIKAPRGEHDQPISSEEILKRGLIPKKLWDEICNIALALFSEGAKHAQQRGLILVDTKYEFGIYQGKLILADEIHTLDSSRYWIASTYEQRFSAGESPEMLDKEPTRQWLLSQGYQGHGSIPEFTDDHRVAISKRYLESAYKITGLDLDAKVGPALARVESALRRYVAQKLDRKVA